jgi:hypothetical protein
VRSHCGGEDRCDIKLVFWFLLLLAGFVIGLILAYSRLQRVQQKLSSSTRKLGTCQSSQRLSWLRDAATMMYMGCAWFQRGSCDRS